ncbi:MarR family transcriptional regulator [Frankia sp. Cas3]|uniref:MarR family transcriptional regulator n=1 Tax=Frankia sp. Cas3 TaxID=3073926 RepID=UPI002AD33252|nr:MarR family transcriptional regulator [Frankia sp. Cas3]
MTARGVDGSASGEGGRTRSRRIAEAKLSLRELRIELAVLNHRVGSRIEIKDVDFDCLDVITRHGPISPSALARRVGVHLATMTGILDRLERGGWIVRDRVESDRRAVLIRGVPDKQRDIFRLYDGMNRSLDRILENYSDDEIDLVVDFLRRCTEAGQSATDQLAKDSNT